ncbi:MAG: hypothetical protein ACD_7C00454G0001 [uncultured bacterium]|nr:MAG: hypothetical protein ACD_7C00454G0001 [uncultured bacterium]
MLGLAISIKNTVIAYLGSVSAVSVILFLIIHRRKIKGLMFNRNSIVVFVFSFLVFLILGGYWYLKNFLISGNPIYPFVFPCWHGWPCGTGRGFFQAWAMAIDKEHFPIIKSILFQKSNLLFYLTLISIILGFFSCLITKNKFVKFLIFIITWSVILEIIISKNVTGFELRYYYHWFLLIPFLLVVPFNIFSKRNEIPKFILLIYLIYGFAFIYIAGNVSWENFKRIYEGDFVPGYIRNYAMHRINLNDWIDFHFPKMNDLIRWCGTKRPMQDIAIADPALIWFSDEGMMRVFMVNCRITSGTPSKKFLLVSETPCTYGQPYPSYDKDPGIQETHKINQEYVCNGKKISKYLYEYNQAVNSLPKKL